MKNRFWTLLVAVIVVILLVAYMFAFQLRYDQVAVLTTFDKATPPQYTPDGEIDPNNPGSLVLTPGLHFKLPWPIQSEHIFPSRIQILDDQPEQQQTADNFAVVVQTYVTWRIQDPHAFFVALQDIKPAERQLHSMLREITSIVGRYKFSDMVNTDPAQLKLDQFEADALKRLRDRLASTNPKYGIAIEHVGIRGITVPETTTTTIFERMKATRDRLAASARSTGEAQAAAIKIEAVSAQKTILSFADRRAEQIRAEGDRQATQYYDVFKQDEAFAIFLRETDALRKMLGNHTTFVLDAHDLTPFSPLVNPPGSVAQNASKVSSAPFIMPVFVEALT